MRRAALLLLLALLASACFGDRSPSASKAASTAPSRPTTAVAEAPLPEAEPPRADPIDLARRLRSLRLPEAAPPSAPSYRLGDQRDFWVVQSDPPRAFQVSATLRAICDPEPWAMARREALSAGTSLTPSPTMAT